MVVNYNVDPELTKPTRRQPEESEEIALIRDFLESENDNISFTYDNEDAARKKRNNIALRAKDRGLQIKAMHRGTSVIVVRAAVKSSDD